MKALVVVVISFGLTMALMLSTSVSQEKKSKDDSAKSMQGAKRAFAKLAKLIKGKKWKDASKLMTPEGADAFCVQTVSAIQVLEMELPPFEVPGLKESTRKLDAVAKKYGLKKLSKHLGQQHKHLPDGSHPPGADTHGDDKAFRHAAIKLLDKDDKRWVIVGEIRNALEGSPFSMDLFGGEVLAAEVEGKAIDLKIQPDSPKAANDGAGVRMEMVVPSMFVRFESTKGGWKFAGLNEKKTNAAIEEMLRGVPGFDGVDGAQPKIVQDPSFTGETVEGAEVKLEDMKGKVVLIDFWGTWCAPCVASLPSLKMLHSEFHKHGLEIVGIAVDDKETLRKFLGKRELPWRNVVDSKGELSEHFGVHAYPTTLLIDQKGKHVKTNLHGDHLVDAVIGQLKLDKEDFVLFKRRFAKVEKEADAKLMKKFKEKAEGKSGKSDGK
jgi:peroxiredoxin